MTYDFIFVGAGPAGLTGAICAARQGRRCLVIEKKRSLQEQPRGETLRFRPILNEILGEGVMESLIVGKTTLIEYFAPIPDKVERISFNMHSANIAFHWDGFMQAFQMQVDSLNIDLMMNSEVIDTVTEANRVVGVVFKDSGGKVVTVSGDVVFASDGHKSIIGRKTGVDYQSKYFPIIKGIYENATFDTPGYKFFFLPNGAMNFAPNFPPALAFLFPRGESDCEASVIVMAENARQLGIAIPSPEELLRVWEMMVRQLPVFSDMLRNATPVIEEPTMIAMSGPVSEIIPQKGVVLLGDASVFVEVSGGSGLVSSMESARFWVNMIIKEQNVNMIIKELTRAEKQDAIWLDQTTKRMTETFTFSSIYRHIKANADRNTAMFKALFVDMRTGDEIIKNWEMVRAVLDVY